MMCGVTLKPWQPVSRQIVSIWSATCSGLPTICGMPMLAPQRLAASPELAEAKFVGGMAEGKGKGKRTRLVIEARLK